MGRSVVPSRSWPSARRPGGPNALADLLPTLPENFPVPIVIVQHMPPLFTKMLAERLTSKSAITVGEATHGDDLARARLDRAGRLSHDRDAGRGRCRVELHQGPQENSCRPAVDVLFRSVATAYGAGALGRGPDRHGSDGLRGCEQIREAGGGT